MEQAPILYLMGLVALVAVLAGGGHPAWGEALDSRHGRLFPGVGIRQIDYNNSAGQVFQRSADGPADLGRSGEGRLLTGVPLALILKQPDLGTAMVLVPVAVVGGFLAGIQWKHALALSFWA